MAKQTYYEVLGVSRTADFAAIKAAYLRIVKETHPDSSKTPDPERFDVATRAYDVLKSVESRSAYDMELRNRLNDDPLPEARAIWVSFTEKAIRGEEW